MESEEQEVEGNVEQQEVEDMDSELHPSEYSVVMRTHTFAFLHEPEPDEEEFPQPGMAAAWLDSGFSVAASAGF
eukprot:8506399-Heterocapsa_arctica.AAC.1